MSRIGIIAALPEEVKMLTHKALQPGECDEINQLIICVAGIGAENALAASQLAHNKGANALISWGCAGALDPQLAAGDFVLADHICNQDGLLITTSDHWSQKIQNLIAAEIEVNRGLLAQTPSMMTTSLQKQHLFESTSAIAVDMESYSVGSYAQQYGLAFIAIRTIADSAQTDLPFPVLAAMDNECNISNQKVLLNTFIRPWTIPSLIRLGLQFRKAQKTLTSIANKLINLEQHLVQSNL